MILLFEKKKFLKDNCNYYLCIKCVYILILKCTCNCFHQHKATAMVKSLLSICSIDHFFVLCLLSHHQKSISMCTICGSRHSNGLLESIRIWTLFFSKQFSRHSILSFCTHLHAHGPCDTAGRSLSCACVEDRQMSVERERERGRDTNTDRYIDIHTLSWTQNTERGKG